jgi:hypothetical protein
MPIEFVFETIAKVPKGYRGWWIAAHDTNLDSDGGRWVPGIIRPMHDIAHTPREGALSFTDPLWDFLGEEENLKKLFGCSLSLSCPLEPDPVPILIPAPVSLPFLSLRLASGAKSHSLKDLSVATVTSVCVSQSMKASRRIRLPVPDPAEPYTIGPMLSCNFALKTVV